MDNKFRYLRREERKKILLLCDDIRMPSGVGTMGREIVVNSCHHFNWINLGAVVTHPEIGKIIDLSDDVNKYSGIQDSSVKVIPNNGYGNPDLIRKIIKSEKPDGILIFTDPRYWIWLFEIEREVRNKIPISYLNIWDDMPAPIYNKNYYRSVDGLLAISKQTKLINDLVLGEEAKSKVIEYIPHGVNEEFFFPMNQTHKEIELLKDYRKNIFNGKDIEFVVFFNSRNIRRKCPSDLILAYKIFCDNIGKDKARKCALVMHTDLSSDAGTDLVAVKDALCDPEYINVYFSTNKLTTKELNVLYNLADVTALLSSNEGWGLSLTESMMSGTMILANVTGGMQDQMRFEDEKGEWFTPSADIPSNHRGTYKKCGEWAIPIFPSNRTLIGSPLTPYIFEDHVNSEDAAEGLALIYNMSKEERTARGLKGREWVTSEESKMSSTNMAINVIKALDVILQDFKPREKYELVKIENRPSKLVPHKLSGY